MLATPQAEDPSGRVAALPRPLGSPSQFHLHGQLSDPLHGAIQFRLHRIALALLSEASIPPIAFSRHCSSGRSLRPTGATEVAPARHAKAAERPHACAPPSIAGQVPAGLPAKPGLGKTWTSQARPHLPQAHQQQLSSQNYRSCSGPPWTLRLSQFCVQGNRVRLSGNKIFIAVMIIERSVPYRQIVSRFRNRSVNALHSSHRPAYPIAGPLVRGFPRHWDWFLWPVPRRIIAPYRDRKGRPTSTVGLAGNWVQLFSRQYLESGFERRWSSVPRIKSRPDLFQVIWPSQARAAM